ncbi:quinol:electron acceptor oxidoreductase subunit ActD [Methylacidiphilum caldifontis]|uniref:Polysulfide reductase n=1 Tax=Methylacidiphilum caldifontis TaxID=2795386 RepID=A0A4Y8P8K1_9BACT|nr:quinol:electron acceptor oxidoreductase subunit ActD [Methylacidiphilum caldifontis]TFE66959.1 polysulfide reductase [Methylacidiphilum caldifontis]
MNGNPSREISLVGLPERTKGEVEIARPPLLPSHITLSSISRIVFSILSTPMGKWWKWTISITSSLAVVSFLTMVYVISTGIGVWGNQSPVVWGWPIVDFVFWIGIGHAGTLISAILLLSRQKWRNAVNRAAEASAIFAVASGAIFPTIHIGRQWMGWYLFPVPWSAGIWQNLRAALMWDVFAVLTYLTVSLLYWYLGMIPDFATLREKEKNPFKKRLWAILSLGWLGSASQWIHYEMGYLCLAGILTPLVLSVHSFVSCDFASTILPGWHATIFPPYFGVGAIFGGFAMILVLLIPSRALIPKLKELILDEHINQMGKWLLATGSMVGYVYLIELFTAWYSANPYERYAFLNRIKGPYFWAFWSMLFCNSIAPQFLWIKSIRGNPLSLFFVALLANVGMWLERFVIIIISLHRDFLPSSWRIYVPTIIDVLLYVGSIGLFLTLFLLFLRFLPSVAMFEVKTLVHPPLKHKNIPLFSSGEEHKMQEELALASNFSTLSGQKDDSMTPEKGKDLYGIGAEFSSPELLCRAAEKLKLLGFRQFELYSPYPFHELSEVGTLKKSWVSRIVLLGGIVGFFLALILVSTISLPRPSLLKPMLSSSLLSLFYPLVVQGKPYFSLPTFIPIFFELTALFASFGAFFGILFCGGLFKFYHPLFSWKRYNDRGMDDGFFLVVKKTDPLFSSNLYSMLFRLGASGVDPITEY